MFYLLLIFLYLNLIDLSAEKETYAPKSCYLKIHLINLVRS